jgi:flagellar biosynthesis protein FlhA
LDASAAPFPFVRAGGPTAAAHSFATRDRYRRAQADDTTDVATSADRSDGPLRFSRLADLGALLKRSDIGLAVGVMAILVVLILPLPSLLLDFALAISITFSVLIMMTALFIRGIIEPFRAQTSVLAAIRDSSACAAEDCGRHLMRVGVNHR